MYLKGLPMAINDLPEFIRTSYEVHEWRHASAVLERDFAQEWQDIIEVLTGFRLRKSHIVVGGGNKSRVAGWLDEAFDARGLAIAPLKALTP